MINNVTLVGRTTKDIEIRKTQGGSSVASFTLAVSRDYKVQGQPDTDFISCVAWNKTAELLQKYVSKGNLIGAVGRIQCRSYDDKDGKKVYITEVLVNNIQFMEKKDTAGIPPQNDGVNKAAYGSDYNNTSVRNDGFVDIQEDSPNYSWEKPVDINNDDLPF